MNEPNMTYKVNRNRGVYYKKEGYPLYIDPFSRSVAWGPPLYQATQTQENLNQLNNHFTPITGCPDYSPIVLTQFNKQNTMDKALEQHQFLNNTQCVNYLPYKAHGFSKKNNPAKKGNHQYNISGNDLTFKQPDANESGAIPGQELNNFVKVNYPQKNIIQACNGARLIQITPENKVSFDNAMTPPSTKLEASVRPSCDSQNFSNIIEVESRLKNLDKPLTLCTKAVQIKTPEMGCPGRKNLDDPLYGELFNNSSKVEYKNPYEYRNPAVVRMHQNTDIIQCMDSMTFKKCETFGKPCDYKYMPGVCENLWNNSTKAKLIGNKHCNDIKNRQQQESSFQQQKE